MDIKSNEIFTCAINSFAAAMPKNDKERAEYLHDENNWSRLRSDHPIKIEKLDKYPIIKVSGFTNVGHNIHWCVLGYYELEDSNLNSPLKTIYNLTINQCIKVMREFDKKY